MQKLSKILIASLFSAASFIPQIAEAGGLRMCGTGYKKGEFLCNSNLEDWKHTLHVSNSNYVFGSKRPTAKELSDFDYIVINNTSHIDLNYINPDSVAEYVNTGGKILIVADNNNSPIKYFSVNGVCMTFDSGYFAGKFGIENVRGVMVSQGCRLGGPFLMETNGNATDFILAGNDSKNLHVKECEPVRIKENVKPLFRARLKARVRSVMGDYKDVVGAQTSLKSTEDPYLPVKTIRMEFEPQLPAVAFSYGLGEGVYINTRCLNPKDETNGWLYNIIFDWLTHKDMSFFK